MGTSLSDMAYLDHCNFATLDKEKFVQLDYRMTQRSIQLWTSLKWNSYDIEQAHQEFTLEILEIYAQASKLCNFQLYKPSVPRDALESSANSLQRLQTSVEYDSNTFARLIIVIVAYKDVDHLFQLIQAVYMPQHLVVIHLERRCDAEFEQDVRRRAQDYNNVFILKFGSILYKTDLISTVNLRIMRFLTVDLRFDYDYYVTLDGAAFPLYSFQDLARALKRSRRHVFLGELMHNGQAITNMDWAYNNVLHHFILTHTHGDQLKSYQALQTTREDVNLPVGDIKYYLKSKTNSGNTAVYSYETVFKLLSSPTALKIHSFSKYGCCHYPEETEWFSMLNSVFMGREALEVGSMFQVWQSVLDKRGSKAISTSNAILTFNPNTTFILADAFFQQRQGNVEYTGKETKQYLQEAKRKGFLFARKFDSTNDASVQVREWIQQDLHPNNTASPFLR